jgi:hypothetical protein
VRQQRDIFSSLAISPRAAAAQKFGALLPGVEHRSVRLRLGKPLNVEIRFSFRGRVLKQHPPAPVRRRPTSLTLVLYFSVELPEPYHSLPIKHWRKMMRANRKSYATGAVRAWLKGRHKIRLQQQPFSMVG